MNIVEAAKATTAERPFITRRSWEHLLGTGKGRIKMLLTDTPDRCVLFSPRAQKGPCRGWEPTGSDLLADDWELCS